MKAMVINLAWRLLGALLGLLIGGSIGFWLGEPLVNALNLSPFAWMSGFVTFVVVLPILALSGAILGAILAGCNWKGKGAGCCSMRIAF